MTSLQDLLDDRALRDLVARFSDAVVSADADTFRSLWAPDGRWTIASPMNGDFDGQDAVAAGFASLMDGWEFLVQTPQYGLLTLDGDQATGRWLVHETGRSTADDGQTNYGLYHDRYTRAADGWRFARRDYRYVLLDTSDVAGTHHSASPTRAAGSGDD